MVQEAIYYLIGIASSLVILVHLLCWSHWHYWKQIYSLTGFCYLVVLKEQYHAIAYGDPRKAPGTQ